MHICPQRIVCAADARSVCNSYVLVPSGSLRSKGVPSSSGIFLLLLVGELGIPKLAQIFAHGKWLYPYRIHGASDLYRRCLKMRNSKDGCTFPPNIFATKYLHPKIPFWGTFQCKTYYRNYILYIIL